MPTTTDVRSHESKGAHYSHSYYSRTVRDALRTFVRPRERRSEVFVTATELAEATGFTKTSLTRFGRQLAAKQTRLPWLRAAGGEEWIIRYTSGSHFMLERRDGE